MRLKLISCEVFKREINAALARSINHVEVEFLPASLHQLDSQPLLGRLQSAVDQAERSHYQAVLLASGSCKKGLTGLQARSIPLVLPRAADCISLFLSQPMLVSHFRQNGRSRPPARCHPAEQRQTAMDGPTPWKRLAFWMAPTRDTPASNPRSARLRFDPHWSWRADHSLFLRSREIVAPQVWPARRKRFLKSARPKLGQRPARCPKPLLQLLVDGYWSYDQFLVVPPGWVVVAKPEEGLLTAEERTL